MPCSLRSNSATYHVAEMLLVLSNESLPSHIESCLAILVIRGFTYLESKDLFDSTLSLKVTIVEY